MSRPERSELRWVILWAVAIVLLASVPYLYGMRAAPSGFRFLGLTQNIDDGAVYLSWTRQVADGHFFTRNLFTNDAQSGRQINILFLLMGGFARLTGVSCLAAYHIFRVLLGIGLLYMIYRFAALSLTERRERLLLIPLVGLSSGIGWLIPNVRAPIGSVDVWQPEAITFLSIYLNPLFLAGLILMLASFHTLLLAEKTGRARYAVGAGVCLLLLGNVHSYDVLTVACVWAAYAVVRAVMDRRLPGRTIALSLLAALIAFPAIAYQIYIYRIDEVFRLRANTPTPSPPIWSFFEGYGFVLLAAIAGAALWLSANRKSKISNPKSLLIVWAVVGFAVPYIPIAQQRKLIMGLHIPLCILAVVAISYAAKRLNAFYAVCLCAAVVLLTFQSNARFLTLDLTLLSRSRTVTRYTPFMSADQIGAMEFLGRHTRPGDTILCSPQLALFVPAYADRQVYYGHWSETPDYEAKLAEWMDLTSESVPIEDKLDILAASRADYVVFDWPEAAEPLLAGARLRKIASYGQTSIYEVRR